jgi:hypothetical protein
MRSPLKQANGLRFAAAVENSTITQCTLFDEVLACTFPIAATGVVMGVQRVFGEFNGYSCFAGHKRPITDGTRRTYRLAVLANP